MRVFSSVMLRWLLPIVAAVAGLTGGCGDGHGHPYGGSGGGDGSQPPPDQTLTANPQKVAIDTGATLTSPGGGGVGVFVQYASGGHWTFTTACDTTTSGVSCGFDLFLSGVDPATVLSNPKGQALEATDNIEILADGSLHFQAITSTGLDGLTFDATPGADIQLEMYLDTQPQPRFVYWIGDKVLHTGAPTDPVDLAPSAN